MLAPGGHLGYPKTAITLQPIDAVFGNAEAGMQPEILRKSDNKTAHIYVKKLSLTNLLDHTCNVDYGIGGVVVRVSDL